LGTGDAECYCPLALDADRASWRIAGSQGRSESRMTATSRRYMDRSGILVIRREGSNGRLIRACAAVAKGFVSRRCLVVTEYVWVVLVPYADGRNFRFASDLWLWRWLRHMLVIS